jgi:hypothetical protein
MISCLIDIYNKFKKKFFKSSNKKKIDLSNQLLKKTEWL